MKFSEAIPQFNAWLCFGKRESTRGTYRVQVMQFGLYMHNCDIEKVDLQDVVNYLQEAQNLGWDQNNFLAKTSAIKKFFEFFKKQGITKLDPDLVPIMEGEYRFPKVAKLEDYEKVINAIPVSNDPRHIRNKAMLMVYRDTGMRLSESLSLNIEDIDTKGVLTEGTRVYGAVVRTKKTKKLHPIRRVFWTHATNEQVKLWLDKRLHLSEIMPNVDPNALWVSINGTKAGRRVTKSGMVEVLNKLSHKANLGYVLNSHSLRHLFGREMAEQNVSDSNLATLMGHASVESSRPYTIMSGEKMAQFYAKHKKTQ